MLSPYLGRHLQVLFQPWLWNTDYDSLPNEVVKDRGLLPLFFSLDYLNQLR